MKVYIGADHRGYDLKESLKDYLTRAGYDVVDEGDNKFDPGDDYPIFAKKVANDVLASEDKDARGIVICGSGQGVCMAANRFRGIRACLGYSLETVRSARNDDNSNVLCLPADTVDHEEAINIAEAWLSTPFAAAPRYIRRINEMDELAQS